MHFTQVTRFVWTLILPLLFSVTVAAQERTISGTIVDQSTGQPLSGVTVMVKGDPKSAVTTDNTGAFTIRTVNPRALLQFTYVGYESIELRPAAGANNNPVRIGLKKTDRSMDEVVVIGYGGQVKKRDLTGAISVVKAGDIVRSPTNDPLEAIQGMVPGADITKVSGKEGSGDSIHVRGTRTISGATGPLYIIDGIQGGNINNLNPNDIESIEVLKDASSTDR